MASVIFPQDWARINFLMQALEQILGRTQTGDRVPYPRGRAVLPKERAPGIPPMPPRWTSITNPSSNEYDYIPELADRVIPLIRRGYALDIKDPSIPSSSIPPFPFPLINFSPAPTRF